MPPNTFISWATRPRIYAYSIISTLAAISTVAIAFTERSNFYAAVVFLGRSNGCLLVLLNFLFVVALISGRILQLIYFGPLRRSEVELVCERSWYSLVGTLLAVSIFRDDFSVSFVILFGLLLFLKIFHWLSAERVASIMQSPSVPRIFHARMVSILITLLLADLLLVGFSLQMLIVKKIKIGMMVLFTSEFIILTALLCNTIAQYILNCIDMASEEPWEAKSLYVLYVDLAHDVVRLCTHAYFFVLLTRMYGIPLSLIHDLYSTGRSCTIKVTALIRYRQAVKKMETKYPNASAADLRATDGTCIICREDMVAIGDDADSSAVGDGSATPSTPPATAAGTTPTVTNVTPKKLACGHIFHFRCLRSWLERQQSCPTCRRMILDDQTEPPAPPQQQQQAPPTQPAPQHPQHPQHAAVAADGSGNNNAASQPASGLERDVSSPEEQAFDTRLQGFLHRLQSDLRKVRKEGNGSARQSSSSRQRRTTSRSGYAAPRVFAGGSTGFGFGANDSSGYAGGNASLGCEVMGEMGGGLWMPPPPSTLYGSSRRGGSERNGEHTTAPLGDVQRKGKGKERAEPVRTEQDTEQDADAQDTDDATVEPIDPRQAIRQATLRRYGAAAPRTGSIQASASTSHTGIGSADKGGSDQAAISLIPLFDPDAIPEFHSTHAVSLPHALAAPRPWLPTNTPPQRTSLDPVALESQISHLSTLQSRIDALILDLTHLLDSLSTSNTHLHTDAYQPAPHQPHPPDSSHS